MASTLKVVLDTNVFISALTHAGIARNFVYKLILKNIKIVTSAYILSEVKEVLQRHKFKNHPIFEALWQLINQTITVVKVTAKTGQTSLRDPKDHPILQTARKAGAQFIVTGDKDLLVLKSWRNITISTMTQFEQITGN